jgi:hypothetical protein
MIQPSVNCFVLFMQAIPWAFALALLRAGNSIAAKMAMIAITTSSSIKVNPATGIERSFRRLKTSARGLRRQQNPMSDRCINFLMDTLKGIPHLPLLRNAKNNKTFAIYDNQTPGIYIRDPVG